VHDFESRSKILNKRTIMTQEGQITYWFSFPGGGEQLLIAVREMLVGVHRLLQLCLAQDQNSTVHTGISVCIPKLSRSANDCICTASFISLKQIIQFSFCIRTNST